MSVPTGYEPRGLVPIIIITDRDGAEQFRFEHPLAISSGTATQNMDVTGLHLHGGVGSDLGRLNISIDDRDLALTDTTNRRRPCLIKPQSTIELWFFVADGVSGPASDTAAASIASSGKWYEGLIMDPDLNRPSPNMQDWAIFSVGIGLQYADRLTSIKREQDRASNGLDFDDTDVLSNAEQIADDLINKTDHFPHSNIPAVSGFTTDFRTLNIKFADFNKHFDTIYSSLQEIANRTGQRWGIRPHNKEIFMFPRGTRDSGILITNDFTDILTTGWDKTKLCLARRNPFGYKDSSSGFGYSLLHGVGGLTDFLMVDETASDSSLDLSTDAQFAFPFIPTEDSVSKLSMFADLASTTTDPLVISIQSAAGGNPAIGSVELLSGASGSVDGITVNAVAIMSGSVSFTTTLEQTATAVANNINANTSSPNYIATSNGKVVTITSDDPGVNTNGFVVASSVTTITTTDNNMAGGSGGQGAPSGDIRRRIDVQPDRLNQKITVSGNYFEQPFKTINMGTRVTPQSIFFVVLDTHPLVRVDYDSTTGFFLRNLGTIAAPTWQVATGNLKLRVHHSHSIDVILENTVSKKSFGIREMTVPLNDFPNEEAATIGLAGYSSVVGKARRTYKPIQTTPPQSVPQLGMTARLIDTFNGMDTFVELTGFDIQMTSFSKFNRGVDSMTYQMEELYFP